MDYYKTYYVPNNMAICLSGDFDPDVAIKLINNKFGFMTPRLVEEYRTGIEPPINTPVIKNVYGPDTRNDGIGISHGRCAYKRCRYYEFN